MIFNKPAQCKHCGEAIIKGTGTDECWIDRGLSRFCGFSGQQHEPAEPAVKTSFERILDNAADSLAKMPQHLRRPEMREPESAPQKLCRHCQSVHAIDSACPTEGTMHSSKPSAPASSTRPEPLSAVTLETTTAVSLSIDDYNQLLEDSSIVYDALKAIYDLTGIELNEVRESLINKDRPFHKGIPVNMPEDTGWLVELAHSKSMSLGDLIRSFVYEKISSLNPAAPRTQRSELQVAIEHLTQWWIKGNPSSDTAKHAKVLIDELAAQPQPAPRPPACLWCEQGNKPVHRLQDGRWIEPCTAIPGQKEEE